MNELNEYLDRMESLVGHPGWKDIEDDAKKQIYQLQADALDKNVIQSWDAVNVARGKAEVYAELLLLPQIIANRREQLNASV